MNRAGLYSCPADHPAIRIFLPVFLAGALALACGCAQTPGNTGTGMLAGNVSIGPLCPVEPCSLPPGRLAAAYAARPITVSTPSGTVVTTFTADPVTGYSVPLNPGTYIVDVLHPGIGGSRDPAADGDHPERRGRPPRYLDRYRDPVGFPPGTPHSPLSREVNTGRENSGPPERRRNHHRQPG